MNITDTSIKILNEAFELNPKALESLYNYRINAKEFVDHPTIATDGQSSSFIGILNGIIKAYDKNAKSVAAIIDENKLLGFCIYETEK